MVSTQVLLFDPSTIEMILAGFLFRVKEKHRGQSGIILLR
jgi:hypothetical protein